LFFNLINFVSYSLIFSIIGSPEAQTQAKYEIELIVAGIPLHGSKGSSSSYGGYDSSAMAWNQYGSFYGDAYSSYAAYGAYANQYPQSDSINNDGKFLLQLLILFLVFLMSY